MISKQLLVLLSICIIFSLPDVPARANEMADMGPLTGSAEGHIWSMVVDDAGNTKGRNEIWQLSLPGPVKREIIVKCPDPYPLEAELVYQHAEHGMMYGKLTRTPNGFHQKEIIFNKYQLIKNMTFKVYARKPSTDQRYQVLVNLTTLDGQPVSAAAPNSTPVPEGTTDVSAPFVGKWASAHPGVTYIMIVTQVGAGYDVTWQENEQGSVTSRGKGKVEDGRLVIDWRPGSNRIGTLHESGKYRSTNMSGAEPFESTFTR